MKAAFSTFTAQHGYALYFTRFQDGRHLLATPEQVSALGRAVGAINRAMRDLPADLSEAIFKNSHENLALLKTGRDSILNNIGFFKSNYPAEAESLQRAVEWWDQIPLESYGPSHYDLIEKNVIYNGSDVIILDPDRIADGWSPIFMDTGVAITRALLASPQSLHRAGNLPVPDFSVLAPFLEGYGQTAGNPISACDLPNIILCGAASRIVIQSAFVAKGTWPLEKTGEFFPVFIGQYFSRARQLAEAINPSPSSDSNRRPPGAFPSARP